MIFYGLNMDQRAKVDEFLKERKGFKIVNSTVFEGFISLLLGICDRDYGYVKAGNYNSCEILITTGGEVNGCFTRGMNRWWYKCANEEVTITLDIPGLKDKIVVPTYGEIFS